MNRIENIVRILVQYRERVKADNGYITVDYAKQIYQLFEPKPSGRLQEAFEYATKELQLLVESVEKTPLTTISISISSVAQNIIAKTTEIKDAGHKEYEQELRRDYEAGVKRAKEFTRAECQQKIEALISFVEWLRDEEAVAQGDWDLHCKDKWDAVLKATHTNKEKEYTGEKLIAKE